MGKLGKDPRTSSDGERGPSHQRCAKSVLESHNLLMNLLLCPMITMETKTNLIIFVKLLVSKRMMSMKFKKKEILGNFLGSLTSLSRASAMTSWILMWCSL